MTQVLGAELDTLSNLRKTAGVVIMQHMWPFTGRKPKPDQGPQLSDLERRVAKLEGRWDEIEIEWSEWFDKFRRLYARLAKRVHDDDKRSGEAPTESPANGLHMGRSINPLAAALLRRPGPPGGP